MRGAPSETQVGSMFDRVVPRYDLVNSLLSMGLDGWWRRRSSRALRATIGDRVLDLGCGTGKLGELFVARRATVVGMDISEPMLEEASRRYGSRIRFVRGSAFKLPFADGTFRGVASGFVLRNLEDLPRAFGELARVVGPGGGVALVDITGPQTPLLRRAFDLYFGIMAPLLGLLVGEREAYRYLSRSLEQLPGPEGVRVLLEEAGFQKTEARGMSFGMVTLWTGVRP